MTLRLFIISIFSIISLSGHAFEEAYDRSNLNTEIPDLSYIAYRIDGFTINKIDSLKLSVEIEHTSFRDLLVTLTSPDGDYVVLHNMGSSFNGTASTSDILSVFTEKSAAGTWELQIYDQIKGGRGKLIAVNFTVNGEEIDYSVDRPIVRLTGVDCTSKWEEITAITPMEPIYKGLVNYCGSELKSKIKEIISNNKYLSYDSARKIIFTALDNNNGKVCSVYSEKCLSTKSIPSNNVMNVEHSWPQSKGAVGIAKADLHHLFPAMKPENRDRSNYPFCDLKNSSTVGTLGYTQSGSPCYEPPVSHKGDLARAMFYFSVRYDKPIDKKQEAYFRKWNRTDVISSKESRRNKAIYNHQGNLNPFIDHPEFVDLISDF